MWFNCITKCTKCSLFGAMPLYYKELIVTFKLSIILLFMDCAYNVFLMSNVFISICSLNLSCLYRVFSFSTVML